MFHLVADAYVHRLDSVAIPITPSIGVRWYGLAYAAGFLIAWAFIRWMARSNRSPISVTAAGDLMFYVIIGVLLGGRLGFAIFYDPLLFIGFSGQLPYWDLLAINKGGMASHGGIIGVILAVMLFAWRHRVSSLHVLDMAALACTPGLMLGRLANFVNGELWGRPIPPDLQADPPWWSVKYPTQITERWAALENPAAYQPETYADLVRKAALDFNIDPAAADVAARVQAEAAERLAQLEPLRAVVDAGTDLYGRVIDAAYAGNQQVIETIRPLLTAYYPSQIFQAVTDGPLLAGLLVLIWLGPRKPGVVGGWFLMGYGALRIASEQFRQPDLGIPLLLGLSRGQLLSVLMILAGAIGLRIVSRRDQPRMGGLIRPEKDTSGDND